MEGRGNDWSGIPLCYLCRGEVYPFIDHIEVGGILLEGREGCGGPLYACEKCLVEKFAGDNERAVRYLIETYAEEHRKSV